MKEMRIFPNSSSSIDSSQKIVPLQSSNHGALKTATTRDSQGFSVSEIYGDLNETDINLYRTATRNTILDSLQERVEKTLTSEGNNVAKNSDTNTCKVSSVYDKLPDTSVPTKDHGGEFSYIDPELVTWDGPDDPENPRNWSRSQKLFQTAIVSVYTLLSPLSSSMLSPAMTNIAQSLGIKSDVVKSLCVSVMVLAWAIGPLIIAPLSESDRVGRLPVLNLSIWIVAVFNLACGFAKTPTQLCVVRVLGGLGGVCTFECGRRDFGRSSVR